MIDVQKDGFIGRITLNNPTKHNALNREAMAQIMQVLADWQGTDIRVVILTGKGKSFCSGVSLAEVAAVDWSENPLEKLCDSVENFPAPIICALQGGVFGGGVELALACDFRVGVEGMKMFVPPARLGIHYEPTGIARAVQRLGAQMARRVFLLAEKFEGEALLAAGFLDFQVSANQLETKVAAMAADITALAPMAVRGMKQTIVELSNNNLDVIAAKARVAECFASKDHAEGLAAMAQKRKPVFKNR